VFIRERNPPNCSVSSNGASRDRTGDLLLAKQRPALPPVAASGQNARKHLRVGFQRASAAHRSRRSELPIGRQPDSYYLARLVLVASASIRPPTAAAAAVHGMNWALCRHCPSAVCRRLIALRTRPIFEPSQRSSHQTSHDVKARFSLTETLNCQRDAVMAFSVGPASDRHYNSRVEADRR
jgi:hypothetical protein